MKEKKVTDLGKDSIGGLLLKLALPAILAQIINVLYNMVDRMYIGHIPKIGSDALTGVGVTMPVIMAISAFAALVSMGGAPRASIMMGKNDKSAAEDIYDAFGVSKKTFKKAVGDLYKKRLVVLEAEGIRLT